MEGERASGAGDVTPRSNASNEATRLLLADESATALFSVGAPGPYRLAVRYSNDNLDGRPAEIVSLTVDGVIVGQFQAHDTGGGGSGWNVFNESPALGPINLAMGAHELAVSVSGGDGGGVEIDRVSAA